MSALEALLIGQLYAFLMIFARTGAMFMTLPGFSDASVSPQIRVLFAVAFALVLVPIIGPLLPTEPSSVFGLALLIAKEILIGVFIGSLVQIMVSAVAFAGFLIATSMSMSNAFIFNPTMNTSNTVVGSFMTLLGMTLFFAMDLHHMLIYSMVDSYQNLAPANDLMPGDMAQEMATVIGQSLMLGLKMAAPFMVIIIGILFAMGLLARMVPQIQVFILSVPIQMLVGTITLMTVLSAMMMYFLTELTGFMQHFLTTG